jgi:hypothetical protein
MSQYRNKTELEEKNKGSPASLGIEHSRLLFLDRSEEI